MNQHIADCHCHILDPVRFAYGADNRFHPDGPEINTAADFARLRAAHGVTHALIVQPNSGYGPDNAALMEAVDHSQGASRGIAIIPTDIEPGKLAALKARGILGHAVNPTFDGLDYYRGIDPLLRKLEDLDMFLQIQVEGDQLLEFWPLVESFRGKILIDHCGRPVPEKGLEQPGFRALLDLAQTGRATVKLSGHVKFSDELYPYRDTWPYVEKLLRTFTPAQCVWGSDWPCLRTRERVDYGRILALNELLYPDDSRRQILWDTPARLFNFTMAGLDPSPVL